MQIIQFKYSFFYVLFYSILISETVQESLLLFVSLCFYLSPSLCLIFSLFLSLPHYLVLSLVRYFPLQSYAPSCLFSSFSFSSFIFSLLLCLVNYLLLSFLPSFSVAFCCSFFILTFVFLRYSPFVSLGLSLSLWLSLPLFALSSSLWLFRIILGCNNNHQCWRVNIATVWTLQ